MPRDRPAVPDARSRRQRIGFRRSWRHDRYNWLVFQSDTGAGIQNVGIAHAADFHELGFVAGCRNPTVVQFLYAVRRAEFDPPPRLPWRGIPDREVPARRNQR